MTAIDALPLYEITQPAEVYYGLDDPVVSPEAAQSLSADLPRGTGEAVEGRHCCFIEHAPAVTDRLLALLDEQTE
jgi:pimeloyl-ACP methyl ester carboxylesterase